MSINFKTRKINNSPKKERKHLKIKQFNASPNGKFKAGIPLIIALLIIIFLLTGIVKALGSIDFTLFLSLAGEDLLTDKRNNTNFLLLGTGGGIHEGADLTDTMIIASYSHDTKLATLLSIPRDLYVKDKLVGSSRINEVYYNGLNYFNNSTQALDHLVSKVEELTGTDIQYYAKIDFQGFKDLINAIGGIDVVVREPIYDPFYPKGETKGYEIFSLAAGLQHMDGEIALKYARSRETSSDFNRSDRQQKIIFAIKQQALKTNILLDKDKIQNILNAIKNNVETNIKVKEILTLGSLAKGFSEDNIIRRLLHDDPSRCGGFLYTPDRSLYGGAFVLIPAGGFQNVYKYSELIFDYPEIAKENARIQILNGTHSNGAAGETKQILQRYCFNINRFGNANTKATTQTTYYYAQKHDQNGKPVDSRPKALDFLEKLIPGRESTVVPPDYQDYIADTDIILELGSDYTGSPNYIEDPFFSLPQLPVAPASTDQTATTPTTNADK